MKVNIVERCSCLKELLYSCFDKLFQMKIEKQIQRSESDPKFKFESLGQKKDAQQQKNKQQTSVNKLDNFLEAYHGNESLTQSEQQSEDKGQEQEKKQRVQDLVVQNRNDSRYQAQDEKKEQYPDQNVIESELPSNTIQNQIFHKNEVQEMRNKEQRAALEFKERGQEQNDQDEEKMDYPQTRKLKNEKSTGRRKIKKGARLKKNFYY